MAKERLSARSIQLDPFYATRLIFSADMGRVQMRAQQLAGDRPVSLPLLQQAVLMADYHPIDYYRRALSLAGEQYHGSGRYKAREINFILSHARSQDELKALTGIGFLNSWGVSRNLEAYTIPSLTRLLNVFTEDEVIALSTHDHLGSILDDLESQPAMESRAKLMRKLLTDEERLLLYANDSRFLGDLTDDETYSALSGPNLGRRLGAVRDQLPASVGTHDVITPYNMASFLSLDPDIRIAMLNNDYCIKNWLEVCSAETQKILETLTRTIGREEVLAMLASTKDATLFTGSHQNLEDRLAVLDDLFSGDVPWKRVLYERRDEMPMEYYYGLTTFSLEAMLTVQQLYDDKTAAFLFLHCPAFFDAGPGHKVSGARILQKLLDALGVENPDALIRNRNFIKLVEQVGTRQVLNDNSVEPVSFGMQKVRERFGQAKLVELCKADGAYFILSEWDTFVSEYSKRDVELIFEAATDNPGVFFDIGVRLNRGTNDSRLLDLFSEEKKQHLLRKDWLGNVLDSETLATWLADQSEMVIDAVLRGDVLPVGHEKEAPIRHLIARLNLIMELFGEEVLVQILAKKGVEKRIAAISGRQVARAAVLKSVPVADRQFIVDHGLVFDLLIHPDDLERLKTDFGLRLEPLFRFDPILKNQSDAILARLRDLQSRGADVGALADKLVKQLGDPRRSDTDKIWYLYTRLFGEGQILKGTDPGLQEATYTERFRALRTRLGDLTRWSEDPVLVAQADKRNRSFAREYQRDSRIPFAVLLHGKSRLYPSDNFLGFKAAEFQGANQYEWEKVTANALNFMRLQSLGLTLIEAYYAQTDNIVLRFGASRDKPEGITHIFPIDAVESVHGRYRARLYDGRNHGKEHKLIAVGVPVTTELAVLVSGRNQDQLATTKYYYSKLPFYVPFIDVDTGMFLRTADDYDLQRRELIRRGEVVVLEDDVSVDSFINRLLRYYSEHDGVHGLRHIENTFRHLTPVCQEIFDANQRWFADNGMTYNVFERLTKIAVAAHDIARGTTEDEDHAIVGAAILAQIADYGIPYHALNLVATAIKQHNLPVGQRWSHDPVTQALYDIDKADTRFERGASSGYIGMITPTIATSYTRAILQEMA